MPEASLVRRLLLGGLVSLMLACPAWAAPGYPDRPVRIIVPFKPGGATDTLARLIGQQLERIWGQSVVVDYKPGAGTIIGADYVAKSSPDGLTIGLVNSSFPLNPLLRHKMPYDTVKDLVPVSMIGRITSALSARIDAPFNNVAELVAYARKHPGELNYGMSAVGSLGHLTVEQLKSQTDLDVVEVPYQGGSQVMTALIAKRIDFASDSLLTMLPFAKNHQIKILATLGKDRAPGFGSRYPTANETVPGLYADSATGFVVAAGTPPEIVAKIEAATRQAVQMPEVQARMQDLGIEPVGSTSAEFKQYIEETMVRWGKLIRKQHISIE